MLEFLYSKYFLYKRFEVISNIIIIIIIIRYYYYYYRRLWVTDVNSYMYFEWLSHTFIGPLLGIDVPSTFHFLLLHVTASLNVLIIFIILCFHLGVLLDPFISNEFFSSRKHFWMKKKYIQAFPPQYIR